MSGLVIAYYILSRLLVGHIIYRTTNIDNGEFEAAIICAATPVLGDMMFADICWTAIRALFTERA